MVDYKATGKTSATGTEEDLYPGAKRQLEIYQWL